MPRSTQTKPLALSTPERVRCAKDVRAALRAAFPGVKFRVTSKWVGLSNSVEVGIPPEHWSRCHDVQDALQRFKRYKGRDDRDNATYAKDPKVPNQVDHIGIHRYIDLA